MNWSFEETGYSPSMLYNYGINATTAQEWNNGYYIAAVADSAPIKKQKPMEAKLRFVRIKHFIKNAPSISLYGRGASFMLLFSS